MLSATTTARIPDGTERSRPTTTATTDLATLSNPDVTKTSTLDKLRNVTNFDLRVPGSRDEGGELARPVIKQRHRFDANRLSSLAGRVPTDGSLGYHGFDNPSSQPNISGTGAKVLDSADGYRFASKLRPGQGHHMLVLSRKWRESIIIGDNIKITSEPKCKGELKLNIEIPPDMSVSRTQIDKLDPHAVDEGIKGSQLIALKQDESIFINNNIKVTAVEVKHGRVRLGIEAPDEVSVHRQEVYEAIQAEGRMGEPPDSGSASKS